MIRAKNTKTFGAAPKAPQFHKRRKPVVGEDLKALKNVMREIEGQNITVQDFILLIAPHTGDKGATLTKVMTDDLNNFRKFCNEAYDTMTRDTNEVMATTQVELGQLYAERTRLLIVNIINCMKSIHDFIPDFNLQQYNMDPEKYLATKFNILELPDDVEVDIARRQLAYHRLNWLQSEGDRLSSENNKLQQRLNELKKIQQKEIADQIMTEREAEAQRIALEKQQAEMQLQLKNLVEELLETIVNEEEKIVDGRKNTAMNSLSKKKIPIDSKKSSLKRKDSKWSTKAAQDIEMSNVNTATSIPSLSTVKSASSSSGYGYQRKPRVQSQIVHSTPAPVSDKTTAVSTSPRGETPKAKRKARPTTRKKKSKKPVPIVQRPAWQDVDINVEEIQAAAMETEQTPIDIFSIGRPSSTCRATCSGSEGQEEPRTISQVPTQHAVPMQSRPVPRQPSPPRNVGRRATAPRDSWGGFL